ncbi:MAG: hypothetical protein M3Y87_14105 [Myxococcota bacterium]|nr:hypothetical protein [Myxococcota bacterium]
MNRNRLQGGWRVAACVVGVVVACGASVVGCGGRQTPPSEGTCHPWREWVPPQQNAQGEWQDGYCRDRPGGRA